MCKKKNYGETRLEIRVVWFTGHIRSPLTKPTTLRNRSTWWKLVPLLQNEMLYYNFTQICTSCGSACDEEGVC